MPKRSPGRGRTYLLTLLLWMVILAPGAARAEPADAEAASVVLLLDRSGSMAKNDPGGLALTGARVFLDLLAPQDRVAVIAFDTDARVLLPLTAVGDGAAARQALGSLGAPTGQWTDIKEALQAALGALAGQAGSPAVVLFTDGKPQTQDSGVPAGYMDDLHATVQKLAGRSVPVFSVGLGQADFDLLGRIAAGTRAETFAATSPAQAVKLFSDTLSKIKNRQVVFSLDGDGADGQARTFQVPPYTRLLTLSAVGSGEVKLTGQGPNGAPLTDQPGARATTGANYVVYTIPNPAPGAWQVRLEGTGRVQGHGQTESLLRLQLKSPPPYSVVDISRPTPVALELAGDPDGQAPLEVWAQGSGEAVQLERQNGAYQGQVDLAGGRLTAWVTRAGNELIRREFRFYPAGTPLPPARAGAAAADPANPYQGFLIIGALLAAIAALLGGGAWNWRRLRRREGVVSGRLGSLSLTAAGPQALIGPGPVLLRDPRGHLAIIQADLRPKYWAPLAGLGIGRRKVRHTIRPAPGVRLQINGAPPGTGQLYHGDVITLGAEMYTYTNPTLPRRPVRTRGTRGPSLSL